MGRIAFVFSGQGDQHPGMGKATFERSAKSREIFDRCDAIRPGTSEQCFSGTEAELCETVNTQPCLFAVEMAAAEALIEKGLCPDAAAGFSLGELAALTCGGVMTLEQGFSLVCRRGELMQREAERYETSMAAVLRLSAERVEEICAKHDGVYPVNYNCPGQVSVSGLKERMPAFLAEVKAAGGRAMPLKVRGGFHSPFMADASAAFAEHLTDAVLAAPKIPVYSDVTGQPYPADGIPALLAKQISSPVRWESIIRNMIEAGVTAFVEIGPGKTLCSLISRIAPDVRRFAVCEYEDLDALCAEVKTC